MIRLDSARSALLFSFGLSLACACDGSAGLPASPGTQNPGPDVGEDTPDPQTPTPTSPETGGDSEGEAKLSILRGAVTDLGSGDLKLGLAGEGTLAATSQVRISQLLADGSLELVAETAIDASGNFEAEVPVDLALLVAQAVDASGQVLGSVMVEASAAVEGDVAVAADLTTETSLEVGVLTAACACLGELDIEALLSLSATITGFVDASLCDATTASLALGAELEVIVEALASATVAAQGAELAVLLDGSVDLDAAVLNAQAQVAAGLAFSASIAQSLEAAAHAQAVIFAAQHLAAELQASAVASAILDVLASASAGQATLDAAASAAATLNASVAAATSVAELSAAVSAFLDALLSTNGGGVLTELLTPVNGATSGLLDPLVGDLDALTIELEANLGASISTMVGAAQCGGGQSLAGVNLSVDAVASTLVDFCGDVEGLVSELEDLTDSTQAALGQVLATASMLESALACVQVP